MKSFSFLFAALLGLLVLGCSTQSGSEEAGTTQSGFTYEIFRSGGERSAEPGEWVFYHIGQRVGSEELGNSRQQPRVPSVFISGREDESGETADPILEVLSKMTVGDSATISITFDSLPPMAAMQYPNDSFLYFDLYVTDIQADEQVTGGVATKADSLQQLYLAGALAGQLQRTEDSLEYLILEEGPGELPGDTATVDVDYYGIMPDGQMFDNSLQRGMPYTLQLGEQAQVIDGWKKGIPLLREGTEAMLFIPSAMAYGPAGSRGIPPNTDLTFWVKLVRISE